MKIIVLVVSIGGRGTGRIGGRRNCGLVGEKCMREEFKKKSISLKSMVV